MGFREIVLTNDLKLINPKNILNIAKKFNNFYIKGFSDRKWSAFIVDDIHVGFIPTNVTQELLRFPKIFTRKMNFNGFQITELNPKFKTYEQKTDVIDKILRVLKKENQLKALRGWRNECYSVRDDSGTALFEMDRSAVSLFGVKSYGVHINGYVKHPSRGVCVWLQQRSLEKQTFPGLWDSLIGGGITTGKDPKDIAIKEAIEEATVLPELLHNLTPAGTISFAFEDENGIYPNTEYIFDLELSPDFQPKINDNEVENFRLCSVQECIENISLSYFKLVCPVVIDFLVRHGMINSQNNPWFAELVELHHIPVHKLFNQHFLNNKNSLQ